MQSFYIRRNNMIDFPLRTDEYGRNFYIVQNGKFQLIPYYVGDYCSHNISRCERSGFWSCFMSPEGKMLHNFQGKRIINRYRKGFTIICLYLLRWGALYLSYDTSQFQEHQKSINFHQKL